MNYLTIFDAILDRGAGKSSYNINMGNRVLIDHIRAATAHKPRESRLFAAIIAQAISDADQSAQEYIRSDIFRHDCYFAGIDHGHLLSLLRKYWVKLCPPLDQEHTNAAESDGASPRKGAI